MLQDAVISKSTNELCHIITVRTPGPKPTSQYSYSLGDVKESDLDRVIFYGNPYVEPKEFMGLSQYFSTRDPKEAQNAVNVLDGGGTGHDCTSAYLIVWSSQTVYLASAPEVILDKGKIRIAIIPHDWRYIVRIANITDQTDLAALMSRAILKIPYLRSVGEEARHPVFYMSEDTWKMYASQTDSIVKEYREIPIRIVPIRNDEARVV